MAKKPKLTVVGGTDRAPRKRGPKQWNPTPLERRTVERCMAIGFTVEQAAAVVGKSARTLERMCKAELEQGAAKVGAKIGGALIMKALKGDTAAQIFFAKCRLGWREKTAVEHTGANGGPILYENVKADADAFTNRIRHLGERYLEAKAREIVEQPQLAAPEPPPSPSEIN